MPGPLLFNLHFNFELFCLIYFDKLKHNPSLRKEENKDYNIYEGKAKKSDGQT